MIAENLQFLNNRITQICERNNRKPENVKLIAVSKNFGIDAINQAIKAGQFNFGENRAQELVSKFEILGNKVIWHFIGNLQKNKVKYAVKTAEYIHSVDSFSLAEEIQKSSAKIEKVQKVLIEIKTSGEETKSGVTNKTEVERIAEYCWNAPNLDLLGLMTIAPFTNDKNLIRKSFSYLRNLKEELNDKGYSLKELSMGMTNDYEIAIEEGATMLRIGSAIFGERIYNQ
ncbi:MAG: YggS family pyridoxal phosphate-dependent enzyme [Ignavibacteriaceae bacterium]|nr:YggS family pyridoxal phosphate-dependent enzyme [Ignavibacteriaceae bacterium]